MIKAVIFDFGGVIVPDLYTPFVAGHKITCEDKATKGLATKEELIEELDRTFGPGKGKELDAVILAEYPKADPQIIELIKSLKPKYKIGCLSNNFSFWGQAAKSQAYMSLFDTIVISADVGLAKPDPEIYLLTAKKLGVAPEECVFIDNLGSNVRGAESVGMQGITFNNAEELKKELEGFLDEQL
ncbi:HAD family phosphatase [Patescibacteria group bacterium]|nr:HAD family phosphatase [Patescibacteria group bacterium]